MEKSNDKLIRDFVSVFEKKDVQLLAKFLHPEIVFQNYGDEEVKGKEDLLEA